MRGDRPWWSKVDADADDIRRIPDAEIDALGAEDRRELADIWQERANAELQVCGGFAAVTSALIEHGTPDTVLKILTRATRDEVRHAEISAALAARYRGDGSDIIWPGATPFPVPALVPSDAKLRATLLAIAMCCINETLACAILEASIERTKSPISRAAQQSILTDEIDHARAGWAHVSSAYVTPDMKKEISENWLVRLLDARLGHFAASEAPFPGEKYSTHGMLTRNERREILGTALEDVVFPGWEKAGFDVSKARAWAREKLPKPAMLAG